MTVAKLIDVLRTFPPDLPAVCPGVGSNEECEVIVSHVSVESLYPEGDGVFSHYCGHRNPPPEQVVSIRGTPE